MARNTQIENPSRISVNTFEDANKYQMSRNRIIDNPNQYLETNVASDAGVTKKSNLFRLAEALKENSPAIQSYINNKIEEQEAQDLELGKKEALENPSTNYEESLKKLEDKSKAYSKGYMTILGFNSRAQDDAQFKAEWEALPEDTKSSTNVNVWIAEKIRQKNAGITNRDYLSIYNAGIAQTASELNKQSIIEKYDVIKTNNLTQVKDYIYNNKGDFLNSVESFEGLKKDITSRFPINNKEFNDILINVAESKAKNGEGLEFIDKLNKMIELNPKTAEGVPVFGKYANSGIGNQLTLTAVRAISEKKNLERNLQKQEFEDTYRESLNQAFILAKEGKTEEANNLLKNVQEKGKNILDLSEISQITNVIENAANKQDKKEQALNASLLLDDVYRREITQTQILKKINSGELGWQGGRQLLSDLAQVNARAAEQAKALRAEDNRSTKAEARAQKEKEARARENKNRLLSQGFSDYKSGVSIDANSPNLKYDEQRRISVKEQISKDRTAYRAELERAVDNEEVKTLYDLENFNEKFLEKSNNNLQAITNFNPKKFFGDKKYYIDYVKKQRYLEAKGVPIVNKLEDWQIEIGANYFKNEKKTNKK